MGIPVLLYDADSVGAKNYLALAEEILQRKDQE
jgi:cellulose biosynthesis protein BcsQ